MNVTVFCEKHAEMKRGACAAAYPMGMDVCLADAMREAGHTVTLISGDETCDGSVITPALLAQTDVMLWWGHTLHQNILDDVVERITEEVNKGMGLIVLHSGHYSKIFRRLMGTPCSLKWREKNERERLWVVDPTHPIARNLGEQIVIPHEEMYGESFAIPTPDELVFMGWFQGGNVMRSGCVFNRGYGRVFYFQPGHETNPTYQIPQVRGILQNAAAYVAPRVPKLAQIDAPCTPELEEIR